MWVEVCAGVDPLEMGHRETRLDGGMSLRGARKVGLKRDM